MRRYFKISLLLLLLEPLFLWNVYAEEPENSSDEVQSSEIVAQELSLVENDILISDIMDVIPDMFDVDLTEEDSYIIDDNTSTRVQCELERQIFDILEENDYDLISKYQDYFMMKTVIIHFLIT